MTGPHDPRTPPPAAPPYGAPGHHRSKGLALAALVVGVLALVTSWTIVGGVVLGIAAIVLGVLARGRVRKGTGDGKGLATAGIVLGVVSLLVAAAVAATVGFVLTSDEGQQFRDCVESAGQDQGRLDACEREFQESAEDGLD